MSSIQSRINDHIRTIPDFPKPGIPFKDITPILYHPELCSDIVDALIEPFSNHPIDVVVGIESRGFIFGMMMAQRLDCSFALVRKKGKLPYKTIEREYDLEYGTAIIEMHEDAVHSNNNVLIHDDLLATGGTAGAAAALISDLGANIVGFNFLIELEFLAGAKKLEPYTGEVISLVKY